MGRFALAPRSTTPAAPQPSGAGKSVSKRTSRPRMSAAERADWDAKRPAWMWEPPTADAFGVQAKLQFSESDDPLERDADEAADHVMRLAAPPIREAGHDSHSSLDQNGAPHSISASLSMRTACPACAGGEEEVLRTQSELPLTVQKDVAGCSFESDVAVARSMGGEPLPSDAREQMERGFSERFDHVRIHRDGRASELSETIRAEAFTLGRDIFFRDGAFAPDTAYGQRLLAHELAHVVQQRQGIGDVAHRFVQRQAAPALDQRLRSELTVGSTWLVRTPEGGNLLLRVRPTMAKTLADGSPNSAGNLRSGAKVTVVPASAPATDMAARSAGFVAVEGEVTLDFGQTRISSGFVHQDFLVAPSPPATEPAGDAPSAESGQHESDGASAITGEPSPNDPSSTSRAPPGPNDVLFHIIRLERPGDVGSWWAQGPKQDPERWSGPLGDWERRYLATFTSGGVPSVLRMPSVVDAVHPTADERADALRLFGGGEAAPRSEAEALQKFANFENRRRIIAHYVLTHPATVRLQLGLFRFVRDINPLHFAFERGFQVGGGKEMFTGQDVSRLGAAAEFFAALALAFATNAALRAARPPTEPTTPMPELRGGASRKKPGGGEKVASRPFVSQCTDAACGGASGEMAAAHHGVAVKQETLITAKGFSATTEIGHTTIPGGFSSPRALAEALQAHAPVPGRTWRAKNVFPKEAGMARGIEPADVVAGIEQGLRDGGGVFIAKTRLGRHFVVIDELRGNVVVFRDPARGARDMKVTEFVSVKWDGDVVLAE
jgi:hypothetical protein